MVSIEYPSDEVLKERYEQIEATAVEAILTGEVVGNPLFQKVFRGDQWSISTQGFINGSSAGSFLEGAIRLLKNVEPNIDFLKPEFLHMSFTEVVYNRISRKKGGFSPQDVIKYHDVLLNNFTQQFDPVRLRLFKILPALDPPQNGLVGRTAVLVAAFLPEGNEAVFKIREEVIRSVEEAGLSTGSFYGGPPRVLFVTLGRFADSPVQSGGAVPLLEVIGEINKEISNYYTDYKDVKVISTSPLDYKAPRGHIEIWPPIALKKEGQIQADTKFLIPSKRLWYHRMQKMLGDKDD